jgi:hypothetical protein
MANVVKPYPLKPIKQLYQYAVKVIQGGIKVDNKTKPIGPGFYFTSVNIHNPWRHNVKYAVKIAIAGSNGKTNTISNFQINTINPDGVTEFDREGFSALLGGAIPTFLESYFVIESEYELDVVGVYTGAAIQDERLGAMHMERVPARIITVCKNIDRDISTGVAQWELHEVPTQSSLVVGPAPISSPKHSTWPITEAPTKWVGTSGINKTSAGDYIFDFDFCLCWTFQNAVIKFNLWADNSAKIYLNNTPTNPPATTLTNPIHIPTPVIIDSGFQIGMNKLRIVVNNRNSSLGDPTPMGMLLKGTLTAISAECNS